MNLKLAILLERLSQAQRVLIWKAVPQLGLSPTQAQVLLYLSQHPVESRRVGALAQQFDLSPPTISDAVASLQSKGLVQRSQWEQDRRVQVLELTQAGQQAVDRLEGFDRPIHMALDSLSEQEQLQLSGLLLRLAQNLVEQKVITVARMCLMCTHFRPEAHPSQAKHHHCALLDIPLAAQDLRVDCPEFVGAGR